MSVPRPPALVLLPGLDGTGKLYGDFLRELGHSIDARIVGYPKTTPMGYEELEPLVSAALPDGPFVLAGESFAGPLAIRLAARHPSGLAGLVLCTTFARNPFPRLGWARPLAAFLPVKSLPRWIRAPLMWGSLSPKRAPSGPDRAIAGVTAAVLRRRIAALLAVDESAALGAIDVPALVIRARRDRVISAAAHRLMLDGLRRPRHVDIDGPHLLLQSRPRECAAAVREFLESLAAAPRPDD